MSWSARLAAVIVAVAALGLAGSAFARDAGIDWTAKVRILSSDRMQYHGKVRSDVEGCQVDRTVRITSSGDLIGKAVTEDNGKYSIKEAAVEDGSKVKFKLKPNRPVCQSETLFVEL